MGGFQRIDEIAAGVGQAQRAVEQIGQRELLALDVDRAGVAQQIGHPAGAVDEQRGAARMEVVVVQLFDDTPQPGGCEFILAFAPFANGGRCVGETSFG